MIKKISETVYESPSFVDTHSHDDLELLTDPARADKRNQGIGAQVIGNCGISPFPGLSDSCMPVRRLFDAVMGPREFHFASLAEYRQTLRRDDIAILQGYNALRAARFGPSPRNLDSDEKKQMAAAVADAIEQGAAGISLGLAYLPAIGADMEELVAIARQTPLLTVHLRNESSAILESVDEAADIARNAGCHLHISHLKISGRAYFKKSEELLKKITRLHEELGVTFDHYPYSFGCTGLSAILPPEISALSREELDRVRPEDFEHRYKDTDWENYVNMCGWDGLTLASLEKYPGYNACSISSLGERPLNMVLRLIRDEPHPAMLIHSQDPRLIDDLMRLPFGCIGTDGLPAVREHPRLTSSFPDYLKRCRGIGLSVEDAVEKAAMLPRRIFHISPDTGGVIRFDWAGGKIIRPPSSPDTAARRKKTR